MRGWVRVGEDEVGLGNGKRLGDDEEIKDRVSTGISDRGGGARQRGSGLSDRTRRPPGGLGLVRVQAPARWRSNAE